MYNWIQQLVYTAEQNHTLTSIKRGFMLVIPIVLTGSFAVFFNNFPLPAYQDWLATFLDGALSRLFGMIFDATVGLLAMYLVISIGYYYSAKFDEGNLTLRVMALIAAIASFFASFGGSGSIEFSSFGTLGVFTAILCTILSIRLFFFLYLNRYNNFHSYAVGNDKYFRGAMVAIFPMAVCIFVFTLSHQFLEAVLHVNDLNELISNGLNYVFRNGGSGLSNSLLFTGFQHFLWVFGIHGGNALDAVAQDIFVNATMQNGVIVSKSFLDNFTLMGGSGTTLCLLIAILIAGRRKSNRSLAHSAAPLALFNINELMVFGMPIVLNPIYAIPFILTPIVSTLIAYGATFIGFMPAVENTIHWATPVFFSGFLTTGSWRGIAVQVIIIAVGTMIYLPFVKLSEKIQDKLDESRLNKLTDHFRSLSPTDPPPRYLSRNDDLGSISKELSAQLRAAIDRDEVTVYYQPFVNGKGTVVGAETLLRWKYGGSFVFPPLLVALATEDGIFDQLTMRIISSACKDVSSMMKTLGRPVTVSVNMSAEQLNNPEMVRDIIEIAEQQNVSKYLVQEVTEDAPLLDFPNISKHVALLGEHDISLAIDDFGMGQSSLSYLRNNNFCYVKLVGNLVVQLLTELRSQEIIAAIVSLGDNLHFEVLAEWVENTEVRDCLIDLGCSLFQGFLYSLAVPLDNFIKYASEKHPEESK